MSAHCNACGTDLVHGRGEDWQVMTCPVCELQEQLTAANFSLNAAREDCHPSVEHYFKRFPAAKVDPWPPTDDEPTGSAEV